MNEHVVRLALEARGDPIRIHDSVAMVAGPATAVRFIGQHEFFSVYADCRGGARKGAWQIRSDLDCRVQFDERRLPIPSNLAAAKFADLPRCEASGLVWKPPMYRHGKLEPIRYLAFAASV